MGLALRVTTDNVPFHRRYALTVAFTSLNYRPYMRPQPPQPLSRQFRFRESACELCEELKTATAGIHYNSFYRIDAVPRVELVINLWKLLAHHGADTAVAIGSDRGDLHARCQELSVRGMR